MIKHMGKLLLLAIPVFLLFGCGQKPENITFSAEIESLLEGAILVATTEEAVSFDKASVGFDKSLVLDFEPVVGQTIFVEALPEVRESYPVQITAVKMTLIGDAKVKGNYQKISSQEAEKRMEEDVVVLDTRTQAEFDEGHIPGAILLPYDEIEKKADEILPDKDKTILVYCRSGNRSEIAANTLIDIGYTTVYDMGGLFTHWQGKVVTE